MMPGGWFCAIKDCRCGLPKRPPVSMPNAACFTGCGCDKAERR